MEGCLPPPTRPLTHLRTRQGTTGDAIHFFISHIDVYNQLLSDYTNATAPSINSDLALNESVIHLSILINAVILYFHLCVHVNAPTDCNNIRLLLD